MDEAIADVMRLVGFLFPKSPVAAKAIGRRLYGAGDDLEHFPLRFRPGAVPGTRERVVDDYVIVYRVDPDAIRILRLWHGREDRAAMPEAEHEETSA